MQDKDVGYDLAEMIDATEDSERLRDLCTEYFRIAIGMRRPTAEEKDTARELFAKRTLGRVELTPERLVQMATNHDCGVAEPHTICVASVKSGVSGGNSGKNPDPSFSTSSRHAAGPVSLYHAP